MTAKIIKGTDLERKQGGVFPSAHHTLPPLLTAERTVVGKEVLSAKAEAELMLTEANAYAQRLREEAKHLLAQTEAETEKARQAGFAQGVEEGRATLTQSLMHVNLLKETFYKDIEHEVVMLVMRIAEKVIGDFVQHHHEAVSNVVKQALEHAIGNKIVVRVHPDDFESILGQEQDFRKLLDRTKQLQLKSDDGVNRGGCVVETEVGTIDATLDTQLLAIKKAFEG